MRISKSRVNCTWYSLTAQEKRDWLQGLEQDIGNISRSFSPCISNLDSLVLQDSHQRRKRLGGRACLFPSSLVLILVLVFSITQGFHTDIVSGPIHAVSRFRSMYSDSVSRIVNLYWSEWLGLVLVVVNNRPSHGWEGPEKDMGFEILENQITMKWGAIIGT